MSDIVQHMQEVLDGAPGSNPVSYWGGALILVARLKFEGRLDHKEAEALEDEIRAKMEGSE